MTTHACALLANKNQPQIIIKLVEPKPFNSNTTQAHAWLSTLKCYFIVVGLTYTATEAANLEAAYQYAVAANGRQYSKMDE